MSHSTMPNDADIFETLRQELRRGSLILAVLGQLRAEHYGYTLRKALSDAGVEIEEGALYPMLRRLEAQGLLTSEWRLEERRNKRFYRLSAEGEAVLARLVEEWTRLHASVDAILGKPS
jgi:DNA-binding PadR family transcriptional regulator